MFLYRFAAAAGKEITAVTPAAMQVLLDFHWPGNVRELENVIERAVALSLGTVLDQADIRLDAAPLKPGTALLPEGWTLDKWEEEVIREALQRANGNKSQAARLLGLSRNAFRYRLSTMGVADDVAES
jgi:DNA-binding NtrC family response regulator